MRASFSFFSTIEAPQIDRYTFILVFVKVVRFRQIKLHFCDDFAVEARFCRLALESRARRRLVQRVDRLAGDVVRRAHEFKVHAGVVFRPERRVRDHHICLEPATLQKAAYVCFQHVPATLFKIFIFPVFEI